MFHHRKPSLFLAPSFWKIKYPDIARFYITFEMLEMKTKTQTTEMN